MADKSLPTSGNPGNLPTVPRYTTIATIIRERVAIRPAPTDRLARQQSIEAALSAALHMVRNYSDTATLQCATGRAIRAASMLKQACLESTTRSAT